MFCFGIEALEEDPAAIEGARVALLSHPAGVTSLGEPSWEVLRRIPDVRLVRLFGPEHGIDGSAQDMAAVGDAVHAETGLPVRSLYGSSAASLAPGPGDFDGVDVLVCDLQDVGARYYTFVWTVCLAIDAAAQAGVRVVVCDRPNPIGGAVEGEPQAPGYTSFVGWRRVPVRHGRTVAELALQYRNEARPEADLTIVPMRGWGRASCWPRGVAWVSPSPNMPSLSTALVYPGGCLVEATNLSEGRGTTRPFEQIGAPFLDAGRLAGELSALELPGVRFRAVHFRPAFHKHAGETCHGVFQEIVEPETYRPYETGLRIVEAAARQRGAFRWRAEAYEFDARPAIDLLTGSPEFREGIDAGADLSGYCRRQREVPPFSAESRLYPDAWPVAVGIGGAHDSGKTTLLEKLVPLLRARGLRVGTVKHTPHDVVDDLAGKDSARHAAAGGDPSAFVRPTATTVRRTESVDLRRLIERDFGECDLVLVEGYRSLPIARIEVGRSAARSVEYGGRDYTDALGALADALVHAVRVAS
ncbi:MAG TPA: molybdopterin-guanine dinucleotide biosynthesis protein B [Thermoanaerobaculia bacterium]|nr:molybdopterin-guanine dinucleotide biosynthesis protein B [Thermoanaerobaculia bacterium]